MRALWNTSQDHPPVRWGCWSLYPQAAYSLWIESCPRGVNCLVFRTSSCMCQNKSWEEWLAVTWTWGRTLGHGKSVPTENSAAQLPLKSEVAERMWPGQRHEGRRLPQPQGAPALRWCHIQSGHRIVSPPLWFEPGCSMTSQSEDSPGLEGWLSGSLTHTSSVAFRDRMIILHEMNKYSVNSDLLDSPYLWIQYFGSSKSKGP